MSTCILNNSDFAALAPFQFIKNCSRQIWKHLFTVVFWRNIISELQELMWCVYFQDNPNPKAAIITVASFSQDDRKPKTDRLPYFFDHERKP